jgi:hypothetical protein
MKTTSRNLLIGAAVAAALGAAMAPVVGASPDGKGHPRGLDSHRMHQSCIAAGPRMLEGYDNNGDGALTQAELDAGREQRRATFDANADGNLSLQEYEALWLAARRECMVDAFQALDADGDGVITVVEFARPSENMVAWLDRNGDAMLTREEMRRRHKGEGKHKRRRHDDDDDDKGERND